MSDYMNANRSLQGHTSFEIVCCDVCCKNMDYQIFSNFNNNSKHVIKHSVLWLHNV